MNNPKNYATREERVQQARFIAAKLCDAPTPERVKMLRELYPTILLSDAVDLAHIINQAYQIGLYDGSN